MYKITHKGLLSAVVAFFVLLGLWAIYDKDENEEDSTEVLLEADSKIQSDLQLADEMSASLKKESVKHLSLSDANDVTPKWDVAYTAGRSSIGVSKAHSFVVNLKKYNAFELGAVLSYSNIRRELTQDQVPTLHAMLVNDDYREQWPIIADIIGIISMEVRSVDKLIEYHLRDDLESISLDDYHHLGKANVRWLGRIGGERAKAFLLQAITKEGVEELYQEWIDSEDVVKLYEGKEKFVSQIRENAIHGLVMLQDPEANAIVEDLYDIEYKNFLDGEEEGLPVSDLLCSLSSAMATRAYIHRYGLDRYMHIATGDMSKYISELKQFDKLYSPAYRHERGELGGELRGHSPYDRYR